MRHSALQSDRAQKFVQRLADAAGVDAGRHDVRKGDELGHFAASPLSATAIVSAPNVRSAKASFRLAESCRSIV